MGGRKTPELKSCFKGMHASLLYAHVYREECPFPPAASEDVNRGYKQRLLTSHQLWLRPVGFPADRSHGLKNISNVITWFKRIA